MKAREAEAEFTSEWLGGSPFSADTHDQKSGGSADSAEKLSVRSYPCPGLSKEKPFSSLESDDVCTTASFISCLPFIAAS